MKIKLDLKSRLARAALLLGVSASVAGFCYLAVKRFVVTVIANPAMQIELESLTAAAAYFPNSAMVQARLASRLIERRLDETVTHDEMAAKAVQYASRAAMLSPMNYENRILLSAAHEMNGEGAQAESDLRAALALAPNHVAARWRLANLQLRLGKNESALEEFRAVAASDPERLPASMSAVWQATEGNVEAVSSLANAEPISQLALAHFLATQARADLAVNIVAGIDHKTLLTLPECGLFLDMLITAGRVEEANRIWRDLVAEPADRLVSNGGFEAPYRQGLGQFDWNLTSSDYARIGMATGDAHSGARALRIAYLGKDTTRLEDEARQLISAQAGRSYRLTCFARADNLATPDGPQVVVTLGDGKTPLAASNRLAPGSYDWQQITLDFTLPADQSTLYVLVKQTPRFSYTDPTQGTVWFDDFVLTPQ
jgi:tetratricopeptide (TPR) repeat protein